VEDGVAIFALLRWRALEEPLNRKGCSDDVGIGLIFPSLYEASFKRSKKQGRHFVTAFSVWVEDGVRTHDLRNHNPTF
jgi:hypothetical protein